MPAFRSVRPSHKARASVLPQAYVWIVYQVAASDNQNFFIAQSGFASKSKIIVGYSQYRNAVASGRTRAFEFAKKFVCLRPTRRYRVTVLTSSKCES